MFRSVWIVSLGPLGDLRVSAYNALYCAFVVAAFVLARQLARRRGIDVDRFSWACIAVLAIVFLGARTYYLVLRDPSRLGWEGLIDELRRGGGTGSLGAYLALLVAAPVVFRLFAIDRAAGLDIVALVTPLSTLLGRIGCLMAGCCYGAVTDLSWGIRYPAGSPAHVAHRDMGLVGAAELLSRPVHPTPLLESAFAGVLLGVLAVAYRHRRGQGLLLWAYFAVYALFRFFAEFLRGDPRPTIGVLSVPQVLSLVILGATSAALLVGRRRCARERP